MIKTNKRAKCLKIRNLLLILNTILLIVFEVLFHLYMKPLNNFLCITYFQFINILFIFINWLPGLVLTYLLFKPYEEY